MIAVEWVATFYEEGNPANKITFDVVESGGRSLLLDERGTGTFEFDRKMERGGKTWVLESTDTKPKTPPQPRDRERDAAIQDLTDALGRFPSPDALLMFYAQEGDLEGRINDNYDMTVEEMHEWCAKIAETLAPPSFTQDQLRLLFTGKTIGPHLYIAEQTIPSVSQNDYDGTYRVECHGCRTLKNATIRQLDILKMRSGLAPMFKCSNPCMKG